MEQCKFRLYIHGVFFLVLLAPRRNGRGFDKTLRDDVGEEAFVRPGVDLRG